MANQVFNRALGRAVEFYVRVDTNDPSTAVLKVIVINAGTTTDAAFKDFDTLADCLPGGGGAAEVTNSGYARKVLTDSELVAYSPDDANDRVDISIGDQVYTAIQAGDAWTDIIVAYFPDTAGADSTAIPVSLHDFSVTPDGSDITADEPATGFFRAQ